MMRVRLYADNMIGRPGWLTRLDTLLKNQYRIWAGENLAILTAFDPT
jgi:hypothetical protein